MPTTAELAELLGNVESRLVDLEAAHAALEATFIKTITGQGVLPQDIAEKKKQILGG